ncbi:MAG: S8 family serine peptidase [Rhodobacterales bacterium]|nr:S8 family serine peptidase [Rhodobacterales bacterium]
MSPLLLQLLLSVALAHPTPAYPNCAFDNPDACPPDLDGQWPLISWIPEGSVASVLPDELKFGSGIRADIAWRYGTGSWDITVAVLDSGIEWQSAGLRHKVRLNQAELPNPQDANGTDVPDGDLDGNGIHNILDWAEDPRVNATDGEDAADGLLDPSDLIAVFSDNLDDDGNGYVDDIAGWDFFGNDNNPYDSLQEGVAAGHGTGVMRDAVAAADDGSKIGVCPNCSMVPLRVGDGFITQGDRVARAIEYVADNQIDVAAMAIGSLTHTTATSLAVRSAELAGVTLVGAAGDENSYHHNWPAAQDPILYVHSIRGNNSSEYEGTISYFNTWGCNNWGPRLDIVAPSDACATGAVAATAGAAGLLKSLALERGILLTPAEIRNLIRASALDIALTVDESDEARTWETHAGWDTFTGYGRLNLGRAAQWIDQDKLPPIANLEGPGWFSWMDPTAGDISITGTVAGPRHDIAHWSLEVGTGADPSTWETLSEGAAPQTGVLGTLDVQSWSTVVFADLTRDTTLVDRIERAHEALAVFRLTVEDIDGNVGVDRMGVWVHQDPTAVAGFPLSFGTSLESGPIIADLDGNGAQEILLTASDGQLHVLDHRGEALPGFPVTTNGAGFVGSPALGDLDGDSVAEVVAGDVDGNLWAWRQDGSLHPGFPVQIDGHAPEEWGRATAWDQGFAGTPALADIDGDGDVEIVIGALDQRLYVWQGDGSIYPGYPLLLCQYDDCSQQGARIVASPALGDIDNDGDLDCAIGTNEIPEMGAGVFYIIDLATAQIWPNMPINRPGLLNQSVLPVIGEGHSTSISLADFDGDGTLELMSNAMLGTSSVVRADGTEFNDMGWTADALGDASNFTGGTLLSAVNNPALGDLNGDGVPDVVIGGVSVEWLVSLALTTKLDFQHGVGVWDGATGDSFSGYPRQIDDISFLSSPTIADVSGDGKSDVLHASGGHFLYAWDADGEVAPSFPHFTGGWSIGGPALGDLDGDGWLEVVITTREGEVLAWHTDGAADQDLQWPMSRHDPQNTGNLHTPLPTLMGPNPTATQYASGCCNKGQDSSGAWIFLPLWLLRRRSSVRRDA